MANLSGFTRQLNAFARTVKKTHADKVKRTAEAVHTQAYLATPIDTSRAMTGWRSQINQPFVGEVPFIAGSKGSTMSEAIASNDANIGYVQRSYKFGDSVYVTNSVPYIQILEDGGVNRTPHGMTVLAVEAGKRAAKK